jgi:hypothetical protein
MMDYTKYTNALPYLVKANFQTKFWYQAGVTVAKRGPDGDLIILVPGFSPTDIEKVKTTETTIDEAEYKRVQIAYRLHEQTLRELFKADLFRELGIEENPKREKLFAKAWEDGHSSGLAEVENCAWNLVDLIKD